MAREELITREDREVWERYRASWQPLRRTATAMSGDLGEPAGSATDGSALHGDDAIDGVEAGRLAAYLDDMLSEAERRAVERRLVETPRLLDDLIAAKAGLHGGHADGHWTDAHRPPQSVRAWATNAYHAELARRRRTTVGPIQRLPRRRFQFRPAMAAAAASLVLVLAAGVGTYFLSQEEPQTIARNDPTEAERKAAEPWDPGTNKIFADPENAYFDALDQK